jgi:hypothetical protein
MAKVYYQGEAGFSKINEKNAAFKKTLTKLKGYTNLYLETDDGKFNGTPTLKLVSKEKSVFQEIYDILASNANTKAVEKEKFNVATFTSAAFTIKLYKSGGGFANVIDSDGNAVSSKTPTTAQQEDAIKFILENGSKYPTKESINKAIGFQFDKSWHESFEKSYNAIITVIPKTSLSQYNYYRDSNKDKIEFLNNITDAKILPDKKDNWNPSDIWCVKKTKEVALNKEANMLYKSIISNKSTIEDLNGFIATKFKDKSLIGISLKKVDGKKATISKIETDTKMADNLTYTGITDKFEYLTMNSYFDFLLNFTFYKEVINYRFRFRPRAKSGQLKTYGEGQPQTAKVFDGAISSNLINELFPSITGWISYCETTIPIKDTVRKTILGQPHDKNFAAFIKSPKFSFVNVSGLDDKETDPYKIRRACVLLYYIWHLETVANKKDVFKKMFLAAKKLNSFSSIHYKVY